MTDLTVLVGYVRNRLREGNTAKFVVDGVTVFAVPGTLLGYTTPCVLVSGSMGGSILLEPKTPLNAHSFVAGGFSLRRATILAKVFNGIRASMKSSVRIHL